ncbi:aminotransferase class V-fold PLP-dependent enzyme, partial [candidate division KSB1 bacterium]|nr:aminotransferase class V-fold PLP-dependent enzyme [candidate division KSB1 bacterium]
LARQGEPELTVITEKFAAFRKYSARLLNAPAAEIAFVANTTEGLTIALQSIPWQPGDNIIAQADAFPASHYILEYSLPEVEKRYLKVGDGARLFTDLETLVDSRTRAVIVDAVNFLTGYRLDLKALGEWCQARQLFSIVDGIQAAGACQIDLNTAHIDFFAAGGLKWLLGPMGTGLLYARAENFPRLKIVHVGWLSAQWEDFATFYPLRPLQTATCRFEWANTNLVGLWGLTESLRQLSDWGIAHIESKIMQTTDYLRNGLMARGMEVSGNPSQAHRSGIVSFRQVQVDTARLFQQLQTHQVICSQREGFIRIAVHYFNTVAQMQQILALLDAVI